MNIKFILLLVAPIFAFGAGNGSGEYDIVPRVINFVIFFSILYYLIAKPIKAAYNGRINSIANRLNAIQEKLKASNGFLPYNDKSSPESIKNEFNLSKNSFKKALGNLYKNKQISIESDGIHIL